MTGHAVAQSAAVVDSLTPEFALTVRQISGLQFSPDGARLTFVVTEAPDSAGSVRHIWMLDVAARAVRRFTTSRASEWSPRWSPDGRLLAFLSDRDAGTHLYLISADGGEASPLTHGRLSPGAFQWSPDGKQIAFLARDSAGTAASKAKDDARVVDKDEKHSRVWLVDVASEAVRPVTSPAWQVSDLQWLPPGSGLIVTATDRPASDELTNRIFALQPADGSLREIATPHGYFTDLRVAPGGAKIAYIGCRVDGPWPHDLMTVATSGGSATNLTGARLDRAILQYQWASDGSLLALAAFGFSARLVRVLPGGSSETLPLSAHPVAFAATPSGPVAFVSETATDAAELYLWDRKSAPVAVSDLNSAWHHVTLAKPEFFKYRSFDGLEIEAELLTPSGYDRKRRLPLVALIHGGPTGNWTDALDALGQLLVRRGYAVFYPNVRGSVGYGQRFVEANRGDWGGGDFKDLMAGIDTLIRRGVADSTRLGVGGWSYGGYMAARAVTQTTRFRAAVVGAGIADLVSEFGTEGQVWYDAWFNGWPYEHPELFQRSSPLFSVSRVRTPTLILHGEADQVDPLGQGQELYRALKHYGVETEFVVYPGEAHHLQKRAALLDRLERTLAWFDAQLK